MPDAPRTTSRRIPPARLAAILGVWVLLAASALLVAHALDDPVGAGARDEAQPAVPGTVATDVAPEGGSLPPLALVLDRPLPAAVADLKAPIRQAPALERLAVRTGDPQRYVELGSVLQLLGQGDAAATAYRAALARAPGDVAATAGLILVDAARSESAQSAAAERMRALAAANPRSQVASFNAGWLAIYRRQGAAARAAWMRTVAQGEDTRLGRTAASLLASLENGSSGRNP